jgi:hypothetical protein
LTPRQESGSISLDERARVGDALDSSAEALIKEARQRARNPPGGGRHRSRGVARRRGHRLGCRSGFRPSASERDVRGRSLQRLAFEANHRHSWHHFFWRVAAAPGGGLYVIDPDHNAIDKVTNKGVATVLGVTAEGPRSEVRGLADFAFTRTAIWFAANGRLYTSTKTGQDIVRVAAPPDVFDVSALPNGVVYFSNVFGQGVDLAQPRRL